ncbi:IS4 family transposase, partial [Bacillus thuringiensis]|nr:IS4 family transposase [Bacillus thuringiensis]
MNPIISNRLNLFAQELQYFLSPVVLQDIAKQVGFVQRSSKYQAKELIALCVWLSQEIASTSLTQLCSQLEVSTGVLMSSEGLNQRFNPAAVAFLREVFTSLLKQKLCSNHSLSAHMISTFNRIRILDATVFQLPDQFATDYQGSGG